VVSSKGKYIVLILSSFVVLYSVVGGMMGRVNAQDGAYPQLTIFTEVIDRIREDYVDEPDIMAAMEGAIRGMVESVDPIGGYLSPDAVRFYEGFDPIGTVGIGTILIRRFDYPVIVTAIPGGAADDAGLGTGDTIEAVDGESLREHNLVEVNQLLSGDAGSTVRLTVIRRNAAATEEVTLTRTTVSLPEVESRMLESRIGYVRIPLMARGIVADVRAKIDGLIGQGARGVVVDLRNVGGGSEAEAVELASVFVGSGTPKGF
jgi:carboxyl-terminal processing protease